MEMKQRKVQSGKHVEKDPKPQKNTPPKRSGQSTSSLLVNFLLWLAIFSAVLASSLYFIKLRMYCFLFFFFFFFFSFCLKVKIKITNIIFENSNLENQNH